MDDQTLLQILTLTSSVITSLIVLVKSCLPKEVHNCRSTCCCKNDELQIN